VIWLRMTLRNESDAPVSGALTVRFPHLGRIAFFTPAGGFRLIETRAGSGEPRSPRAPASHFPAARFWLAPGASSLALIRIESSGMVVTPVMLLSDAAFERMVLRDQVLFGAGLGVSAALAIYALAVWRALRDPAILAFAAFCSAAALYGAASLGMARLWLTPDLDGVAVFLASSGALFAATAWFFDAFLRAGCKAPRARLFLRVVMILGLAAMATPWLPKGTGMILFGLLAGPGALGMLALALKRWRAGAREGRDAVIGWGAVKLSTAFIYLRVFDVTPYTPINHYLGPIACAFACLWFAAALATRLRRTQSRVAELERWRSGHAEFFAGMSHDLRTPLNGVIGLATLLKLRAPETMTRAERDQRLDQIRASGEHMLALVERVLDFSKLDAGAWRIEPGPCDLGEITRDCVAMAAPLAERAQVRLTIDGLDAAAPLEGDRHALTQALMNLLSNAIKFSDRGDTVKVVLRVGGGSARLSVIDEGPGIAPEDIARVMEPYGQSGDAARRRKGTGLGLPMARRMAELHGGGLSLKSRLGHGTAATLSLPLAYRDEAGAMVAAMIDPNLQAKAARA
jgi:signal transduction histidine kinase